MSKLCRLFYIFYLNIYNKNKNLNIIKYYFFNIIYLIIYYFFKLYYYKVFFNNIKKEFFKVNNSISNYLKVTKSLF